MGLSEDRTEVMVAVEIPMRESNDFILKIVIRLQRKAMMIAAK